MQHTQSPLSQAISKAAAQAEVRRLDISRTTDAGRTARLLLSQSHNHRLSPLGSDQLFAMALEAAAAPGDFHAPALDALRAPPAPLAQIRLRQEIFRQYDPAIGRAVATAAPDWVLAGRRRLSKHDPKALAGELQKEAALNAALWDHPALPADAQFRGLMLACVAPLRDRAFRIAHGGARRVATTAHAPS